jgi:hypothetical protein
MRSTTEEEDRATNQYFARKIKPIHGIILSEADEKLALSLLAQAKKLKKVCPDADFREDGMCRTDMNLDCPIEGGCNDTGTLPIEAGDVVVKLREG